MKVEGRGLAVGEPGGAAPEGKGVIGSVKWADKRGRCRGGRPGPAGGRATMC